MKKIISPILIATVWFALSGSVFGATLTDTLDVSVNAVAACSTSVTGITFADYDGSLGSTTFGDITVTCPFNMPYNIALDAGKNSVNGGRNMADNLNNLISYNLYYNDINFPWGDSDFENTFPGAPSVADAGTGSPQTHTVMGELPTPAFGTPAPVPGLYTDTVTVTLHY